ncbi:hypothetical protein Agabi119p4_9829 [Agaricus bisporus var. burnettii]|uniref:Uncharacterized protein n=1 Tax=Agaricus bisporus var. burnettii TaxID=192524 RepID=A0A8H7C3J6_AGABI|nr:hypothetical protein Agabi119p4_9829 [Agaricus bisporus var. burnettii]
MADHCDRPYPARPSRPLSPTGSVRSSASKCSTRSMFAGALSAAKTSIKSLGSPKPKRKNHITSGLEEHREREKTLFEQADKEIVPTSQESEKELEELREERLASRRYADDSDEEEVVEDSDEENNDAKAAAVPSQTDSNIWNQFSTPPAELMTTPPLPSPLDVSQSTYGFPTPSPALLDHPALKDVRTSPRTHEVLPDLDKTPTTPQVMKITEAEAYMLKVRAANDTDSHIMTGVSMSSNQFEENVNKSKEIVGEIIDEEIWSLLPNLPSEPWTFTEDQVVGFRENLNGILNSMAHVTPRMATNPDIIAKELALFVSRIINSEWADVNVGHMSIASAIREAATSAVSYQEQADLPPIPPVKNVKFALTPIPTPSSAPNPMEVDVSPPRIPAAAKGKKKASPLPPTPQHLVTTSPVIASPIKISAVHKPLVQLSKTGQQGQPVSSYMPYKLSVVTKPTAINETLAGVTPRPPEQFLLPSGKGALGKSGAPTTAEHGNRSGPPPVPLHSKPNALPRSAEMKNNARAFAARVAPKSYAQAAKQYAAPTAPAPIVMEETVQWAKALKEQCPEMMMQDALKAVAPVVNTLASCSRLKKPPKESLVDSIGSPLSSLSPTSFNRIALGTWGK